VIVMAGEGLCEFEERRFDAAGHPAGTVRESFEITG
jgi:hypothetical protein